MPFRYYFEADINCLLIKHSDPIGEDEVRAQFKTVFEDPHYAGGTNILRDCSEAALPVEWTWERLVTSTKEMMKAYNIKLGRCKIAWAVQGGTDFATIHQYLVTERLNQHNVERRIFRDIAEARQWLGIPDGYVINYPD